MKRLGKILIRGTVGLSLGLLASTPALPQPTELVSTSSTGVQGNDGSFAPSLSSDGRYVAFWSYADNLVIGDANGFADIFVRDRVQGVTERVSVGPGEAEANGDSYQAAISTDGRYVTFWSLASNLVAGDENGVSDIFVYDRQTGQTELASVSSDGQQAENSSYAPSISADGRYVAFWSLANDLVLDDANEYPDVFVRDRETGITELIPLPDSCWFTCWLKDIDELFGKDPAISADGRYIAFVVADALDCCHTDFAIHDRQTGESEVVILDYDPVYLFEDYVSFAPAISADNHYVAFNFYGDPYGPNTADEVETVLFVHDLVTRTTENANDAAIVPVLSVPRFSSRHIALSADGRYVTFTSIKGGIVPGDTNGRLDTFVIDRDRGAVERVSTSSDGSEGNGQSVSSAISANGRFVAFESQASNLVSGDINGVYDIFVRDRGEPGLDDLIALVDSFSLAKGVDNALGKRLDRISSEVDGGSAAGRRNAANQLEAFIAFVASQRGRSLTEGQATQLTAMAGEILVALQTSGIG